MAAPAPRLLPAKQPHLPDQRTPEQRYWRSFKVISPLRIWLIILGTNYHKGIRIYRSHALLPLTRSTQSRHLLVCTSSNLQSQLTATHKKYFSLQRYSLMCRIPGRRKTFTCQRQIWGDSSVRPLLPRNPPTLDP